MSEIIFESLELENFAAVSSAKLRLEKRGLMLIQGVNEDDASAVSNGAGKSSVPDGLCWTLFGTTAREESGDAVINRFVGKNCRGSVAFRDGPHDRYVVTRYRKHKTGKNRLVLEHNGVDITDGTDRLTQDKLEKILGCTLDVFVASIYAGQEKMPDLPAMTDKELKLLVEDAAGIKVLERAYEIAGKRALAAERVEETQALIVGNAEQAVSRAELEVTNAQLAHEAWEESRSAQVATKTAELSAAITEAKATKELIAAHDEPSIIATIDLIKGKLAAVSKPPPAPVMPALPPHPQPPEFPESPASPVYQTVTSFDPRSVPGYSIPVIQHLIDTNKKRRESLSINVKQLTSIVGTPCGECGKTYAADDLDGRKASIVTEAKALRLELDDLESKLAEQNRAIEVAEAEHRASNQLIEEQNAQLQSTYEAAVERRTTEYNEIRAQHERVQRERLAEVERIRTAHTAACAEHEKLCAALSTTTLLGELSAAQAALTAVTRLQTRLATQATHARGINEQVEVIKKQVSPWIAEQISREKSVLEAKSKHAADYEKWQAVIVAAKDARDAAQVFAPNGVRGEIIDTVTPFLNARTAEHLGVLSDGNVTAVWSTVGETAKGELRERFHISVHNKFGAETFRGQSGGEKRKVRLATAMALQDLVASRAYKPINLFLCDEIDDALDEAALERLMVVLQDKARARGTVIVISHNSLTDWISNSVTMRKKGGLSMLEDHL